MTLPTVESLVREKIGLDPASLGAATLPRAVAGRMHARGIVSEGSYAGLLANDPNEWAALQTELVVPETWFFRGGQAFFAHLAAWVRDRAVKRGAGRPVRVLSVPCSTGEEPYSLAITFDEEGLPSDAYRIDGVELSGEHLLRAVAARYSAFSFREASADPRSRYFLPAGDGRWDLAPRIRAAVRFRPGNLVDPAFLAGEQPYDLILCRNLFIYLTDDARTRAVANLDRLLADDGRLCLTPAEADRLPSGRFAAEGAASFAMFHRTAKTAEQPRPGVIVFPAVQRPTAASSSPPRSGVVSLPTRAAPHRSAEQSTSTDAVARAPADGRSRVPPDSSPKAASPAPDLLAVGLELANAGRLDEARTLCEQAVQTRPTADLFGLLGVVHLALGNRDDATDAFRKALYLDPDHVETLTHMLVLSEQRGEHGQTAGFRRRLARLGQRGASA